MHECFVSYSSKDQKMADAIVNYLESEKIRCWIAYRDADAGDSYAASIIRAIRESSICVLVLSENANSSKHVLKEIEAICKHEKIIIPFKIDNVQLNDTMEYHLSSTHWLDAIEAPIENHFNRLVIAIKKHLGIESENKFNVDISNSLIKTNIENKTENPKLISGLDVKENDIRQALELDHLVYKYDDSFQFPIEKCLEWHSINPDIYFMLKDIVEEKIIAYVNLAPITKECFDIIKTGEVWDIEISEDSILPYEFPGVYYLNFTSIVVHPDHRNVGCIIKFIDAIANKIISLSQQEIYFKAMVADAVTPEGEKFCKMFGMQKVLETKHDSKIYSVSLLPPEFKKSSKSITRLFECYHKLEAEGEYDE
jgi:hypothetical protein